MEQIRNIDQLHARVRELKLKQKSDWKAIKGNVKDQYEKLKPSNLINNLVGNIPTRIDPESDFLEQSAGVVSNLVVNSLLSHSKNKALKKWLSLLVFYGLTYVVSRYREEIIEAGNKFLNYISDRLHAAKEKSKAKAKRREEEKAERAAEA